MSSSTSSAQPPPQNPRSQAKKKMHMTDSQHAVVRLLPSTGLEGAFRVHFLPDSLRESGLKIGDTCEITCVDGTTGYGIAWQAADSMGNRPKIRPAKMTETFQTAFGFQDGSKVAISRSESGIYPADRMVLSDITPPEYNNSNNMDAGMWIINMKFLFGKCEALAPGISFDVNGKGKARKRFYIESIESREAPIDSAPLYIFKSSTVLMFPEGISGDDVAREASPSPQDGTSNGAGTNGTNGTARPVYQLNTERIGGLLDQCRSLNRHMRRLLERAENLNSLATIPNNPILIHGYEGTGKTLLLDRLAQAPFRRVIHIDRANLPGGTLTANKRYIRESFAEAVGNQPSLVLLDNLDSLSPADDTQYADVIALEMQDATKRNMRVMVVGASKSPLAIHSSLLGPDQFSISIELPIPNLEAREQILNVLQGKPVFAKNELSTTIAEQTHGYTAKDVASLYKVAAYHGYNRYEDEVAEEAMGRSPTPPAYDDIVSRSNSTPTPTSPAVGPSSEPILKDFEVALKKVKPTALREIFTEKPTTKWTDIGGSDSVKERFDEAIEWPLRHKELMLKHGVSTPKGVLLYGPPGCSKTLTAQAVANSYKLNFIAIKGAELISMYVGESERAVREVFRKARQAAPCVIFFDEIDSIGSERDSTGTKGLNVLTTLLNEMDGFEALKDVFILAATNKPASLDPALLRPGRFDKHIYLGPPNVAARKEIITLSTRGVVLAKDVDFDQLATDLDGYSGAEVVRICQNAKMASFRKALRGDEDHRVTAADFWSARSGVKKGITQEMLDEFEEYAAQSTQE